MTRIMAEPGSIEIAAAHEGGAGLPSLGNLSAVARLPEHSKIECNVRHLAIDVDAEVANGG